VEIKKNNTKQTILYFNNFLAHLANGNVSKNVNKNLKKANK
jgi:hypothetical protein